MKVEEWLMMNAVDMAIAERRGKALTDAVRLVHELAANDLADCDSEDDSDEILCMKGLIVRARRVSEELREMQE